MTTTEAESAWEQAKQVALEARERLTEAQEQLRAAQEAYTKAYNAERRIWIAYKDQHQTDEPPVNQYRKRGRKRQYG